MGWSYKDKEIFTKQESIDLFDLSGVGKFLKIDMNRILFIKRDIYKDTDLIFLENMFSKYKNYRSSKESILLKSMKFFKE